MVSPILGPVVEQFYNDIQGTGSIWRWKEKYKQNKPFDLVLPYKAWELRCVEDVYSNGGNDANAHAGHSPWYMWASHHLKGDDRADWALFQVYQKLIDEIRGETSQLANMVAERRQAASTIVGRCRQLKAFIDQLRVWNLPKAAAILAQGDPVVYEKLRKSKYRSDKNIANQWLEWHFGIDPTIKDIYAACEVFSQAIPMGRYRAAKKNRFTLHGAAGVDGQWTNSGTQHVQIRARTGCHVRMNNPDLALLQSLGLANPFSVLWEVTSWSFVYDWFSTVGAYLGSLTDTLGLDIINPWHSVRSESVGNYRYYNYGDTLRVLKTAADGFGRYQGLPDVKIRLRPYKDLSVTRAVTAMSLLIQKLPNR